MHHVRKTSVSHPALPSSLGDEQKHCVGSKGAEGVKDCGTQPSEKADSSAGRRRRVYLAVRLIKQFTNPKLHYDQNGNELTYKDIAAYLPVSLYSV